MKKWYQSRTLWFNILSLVALVLQSIIERQLIPKYLEWETLGIVVVNFLLRILTNTGISTLPPPAVPPTGVA